MNTARKVLFWFTIVFWICGFGFKLVQQ